MERESSGEDRERGVGEGVGAGQVWDGFRRGSGVREGFGSRPGRVGAMAGD